MMLFASAFLSVAACAPSTPVQDFASKNGISLRYSAYDSVPTLTAEAREMAVQHCAEHGKHANYKGGNAANAFTTEEIHQFACEKTKTDDSAVIAAQSKRPTYIAVPTYQSYRAPQQTSCMTVGDFINCQSY